MVASSSGAYSAPSENADSPPARFQEVTNPVVTRALTRWKSDAQTRSPFSKNSVDTSKSFDKKPRAKSFYKEKICACNE